jgi:hypothetical protein
MKPAFKLTLLAAAAAAVLAVSPASAAQQHHAKGARAHNNGGVYLLENRGYGYGSYGSGANTNAAESFQDQFSVDY